MLGVMGRCRHTRHSGLASARVREQADHSLLSVGAADRQPRSSRRRQVRALLRRHRRTARSARVHVAQPAARKAKPLNAWETVGRSPLQRSSAIPELRSIHTVLLPKPAPGFRRPTSFPFGMLRACKASSGKAAEKGRCSKGPSASRAPRPAAYRNNSRSNRAAVLTKQGPCKLTTGERAIYAPTAELHMCQARPGLQRPGSSSRQPMLQPSALRLQSGCTGASPPHKAWSP